jgi:hypothetical protein
MGRRTLRLVARYANACNLFDIPDGGKTIARSSMSSPGIARDAGRSYEEIEKTVSTRLEDGESVSSFAARCEQLGALGIQHAVVISNAAWSDERIAPLGAAVR